MFPSVQRRIKRTRRTSLARIASRLTCTLAAAAALGLAVAGPARADSPPPPVAPPAFATFSFADGKTVRAFVSDPQTVAQLMEIAAGKKKDMIPNGIIVDDRPGKSPYDPKWSWHFKPETIHMADVTIEVCDGTPSYIEENMDEWFQGQKEARYCSWSAHLEKLEPVIYGDVNGDSSVTLSDAQGAIHILIGRLQPSDAQQIAADVFPFANGDQRTLLPGRPGDGVVDLHDAFHLLRMALGFTRP